ncbi:hypothetical protein CY34DRAFT_74484, partial [Suillus luteus UH-Slu-Lm8-n1]
ILSEIKSWIGSAVEDVPHILWWHGTAGTGKPAITHPISEWFYGIGALASSSNSRGKGGAVSRFIVAHVLMIIAAFQERSDSNLWQLILRLLASRLPSWKIGFLMNLRILVTSLIYRKASAMHYTPCHMFVVYSQNKACCFIYPPGCQICAIFSTIHTSTPLLRNLTARLNVLVLPLSMEPLRVDRNANAFSTQG